MAADFFPATNEPCRGVVLVVHGLNTKPEVMNSLIEVLRSKGYHCYRISLYAEGSTRRTHKDVIIKGWLDAVAQAYDDARSDYSDQHLFALSFSIGALITVRFLDATPQANLDGLFLLAPPVALTRTARLVQVLTPLRRLGAVLPSVAPAAVRARRGTPLSEYAAMLEINDAVQALGNSKKLDGIQAKIVLDRRDELVSFEGVSKWLDNNELNSWSLEEMVDRASVGHTYRHLIVREEAVGHLAWARLTQSILAQFSKRSKP